MSRRAVPEQQPPASAVLDPARLLDLRIGVGVPNVRERLEHIRRALIIATGILTTGDDPEQDSEEYAIRLEGEERVALLQTLKAASMDAYWLQQLEPDVLTLSAPDDDQRHALDALGALELAGGVR